MNIVTMCRGGNVRSVAAKQILSRYLKHEVIAIGAENTNNETKKLVFDWADKIILMHTDFIRYTKIFEDDVYLDFSGKVILLDVGNDIWGDPFNEDLQCIIVNKLYDNEFNEIRGNKIIDCDKVIQKIRQYKNKLATRNKQDAAI